MHAHPLKLTHRQRMQLLNILRPIEAAAAAYSAIRIPPQITAELILIDITTDQLQQIATAVADHVDQLQNDQLDQLAKTISTAARYRVPVDSYVQPVPDSYHN